MKNILFLILFQFILSFTVYGQVYRYFKTAEYESIVFNNSPLKNEIMQKESEFVRYLNNEFSIFEQMKPVTLPIVFNIVVSNQNQISHAQIYQQLIALNKAFSNKIGVPENDYFYYLATDSKIRFCVPEFSDLFIRIKEIPQGTVFNSLMEVKTAGKGLEPYMPEKYINIWITEFGNVFIDNQEYTDAGYAQLPFRDVATDGIVINAKHFGEQPESEFYKEGYTLAHLMGIYLGLKPLVGFSKCGGDNVDDTPDINAETLICWAQDESHYVSDGCFFNDRRLTRNFMDNIPDDCAAMFTYGQCMRMQGILGLKGPRHHLVDDKYLGCESYQLTEIVDIDNDPGLSIFPNPSNHTINVKLNHVELTGLERFEVLNFMGQKIKEGYFTENTVITVNDYAHGSYFLIVKLNCGKILREIFQIIQ